MLSLLLLAATLPVIQPVSAQPAQENLADYVSYGDRYFIEVLSQPSATPGRTAVLVSFRLTYDLLTFRREAASRAADLYTATPSAYIEAVAPDGVIADRGLWRDTLTTASFAETNSKTDWMAGSVSLLLRPGLYTLKYTIGDDGPEEALDGSIASLRIDDFSSASPAIGLPLFLRELRGDTLVGSGIGGGALFGRRLRLYVPLAGIEPGSTLRYNLLEGEEEKRESGTARILQSGMGRVRLGIAIGEPEEAGGSLLFPIVRESGGQPVDSARGGAIIDARIDDLVEGTYVLLLTAQREGTSVTDSVEFMLQWVDKPVALYRPAYAIRALYPIATEQVVDSLLELSAEQQERALGEFWEERDPTPATRFNEAMAEYYRRVDYSYFNFRSIGQKDGVFTDRGKVYMLFGEPTQVNRQMQPDSHPREVWTYENRVARVFVFIDESKTGEYRLVEYHDL